MITGEVCGEKDGRNEDEGVIATDNEFGKRFPIEDQYSLIEVIC
jgi:hypothetical protein